MTYKIIRFQQSGPPVTLQHGLTLEEAEAHCADPETSSRTATCDEAKRLTERIGPWFCGYDEE